MINNSMPTKRDWPLGLMLDEIWLKGRRKIIHELEKHYLWIETQKYSQYMNNQRQVGHKLKDQTLKEVLCDDYMSLNSEIAFGASNRRFISRLPFSLAFGFEIGSLFCSLLNKKSQTDNNAALLSALFNLGISLFDLIVDSHPELFKILSETLNKQVLVSLIGNPEYFDKFKMDIQRITRVEVRILLKIVVAFFEKLDNLKFQKRNNKVKENLYSILIDAYESELLSQNCHSLATDERINVSRCKSTLPFWVIKRIADLHSTDYNEEQNKNMDGFVDYLASSFWLLDDIVDLVRDIRSNSLNSILVKAESKIPSHYNENVQYSVISELLNSSYIEQACEKLSFNIVKCIDFVQNGDYPQEHSESFKDFYLVYIRDWLI